MGKTNRTCITCGKNYYYCPNCSKTASSPRWMLMWDTENCKNIFEIVSNFDQGVITKEVARKKLEKCNLREKYTFKQNIVDLIDKIMAKDSVQEKAEPVEKVEVKEEKVLNEEKDNDSVKKGRLFNSNEKKTEEKK